jgi:hypothetical protein
VWIPTKRQRCRSIQPIMELRWRRDLGGGTPGANPASRAKPLWAPLQPPSRVRWPWVSTLAVPGPFLSPGATSHTPILSLVDEQARALEEVASGPSFEAFVAGERDRSASLEGRSVFGWEKDVAAARKRHAG